MYLNDNDKARIEGVGAAMGLVFKQDSIGYHGAFYSGKPSNSNGTLINIGRPFTESEVKKLVKALPKELSFVDDVDRRGMKVIDFSFTRNTFDDLHEDISPKIAKVLKDIKVKSAKLQHFRSDGNLITDWNTEKFNEKNYRKLIKESEGLIYGTKNNNRATTGRRSNNYRRDLLFWQQQANKIREKWYKKAIQNDKTGKLKKILR